MTMDNDRREMAEAIRGQAQRLADDCKRRDPRVLIRCEEGCDMFTVYDHPKLGRVIVKLPMPRPHDHAGGLATPEKGGVIATPIAALVEAAGGGLIGSLVACPKHVEAAISPEALGWLARQEGEFWVRFADLETRKALPYSGIEVYDLIT